jgi:tRNA (guanine37-N1)-methyltransferase
MTHADSAGAAQATTATTASGSTSDRFHGTLPEGAPFRVDVFTIFTEVIERYGDASILGRARAAGHLDLRTHDVREATTDAHRSVDDAPFGGGAGMVLAAQPVFDAVERAEAGPDGLPRPLFLLSPSGRRFDQSMAAELAECRPGFSLLCGRYEGVDQRVADHLVDGELSVGDYVLAGGELAALVVIEAVARLVPHVLGNDDSASDESFTTGLLEYPQYTRPAEYRGWEVPEVVRSGDHGRIQRWRRAEALIRTLERRPDLIDARGGLAPDEVELLVEHGAAQLLRDHGYDW